MTPELVLSNFALDGAVSACNLYGNGHINTTYKVDTERDGCYILQKVNTHVFKDPAALMRNIILVTDHLAKKAQDPREVLTLVPTKNGEKYLTTADGEIWRVYYFVKDSVCFEHAASLEIFYESASAFGNFQRMLADFPDVDQLAETIVDFHNTPVRYAQFDQALAQVVKDRAKEVQPEIDFVRSYQDFASTLVGMTRRKELPLRVTHNDTKLNNILFDKETLHALCVIDLDTVMPGMVVNDFGDSIRFGAVHSAEDEKDLKKVFLDLELYRTYSRGFLDTCKKNLTANEIEMLPVGAKMMTLECGVRFLTDYLAGDTYFRISRPEQNLDRCRTQFKLVADMDQKWDEMQRIIHKNI